MKQETTVDPRHVELATDEQGRLYARQMREIIGTVASPEARIGLEAMAALTYAARVLHLDMERWFEKQGLSETRVGALLMLRHAGGPVPLGALAAKLHVSARNVTGLIDNLERDGLVVRVPDPTDRRSIRAELTAEGRERIDPVWQESARRRRQLVGDFTEEELAVLRHLVLRIVQNLQTCSQIGK